MTCILCCISWCLCIFKQWIKRLEPIKICFSLSMIHSGKKEKLFLKLKTELSKNIHFSAQRLRDLLIFTHFRRKGMYNDRWLLWIDLRPEIYLGKRGKMQLYCWSPFNSFWYIKGWAKINHELLPIPFFGSWIIFMCVIIFVCLWETRNTWNDDVF